jgi:hypothetical protein
MVQEYIVLRLIKYGLLFLNREGFDITTTLHPPPHKNHRFSLPIIPIVDIIDAELVAVFQVDATDDDEVAAAGSCTLLNKGAYEKLIARVKRYSPPVKITIGRKWKTS